MLLFAIPSVHGQTLMNKLRCYAGSLNKAIISVKGNEEIKPDEKIKVKL